MGLGGALSFVSLVGSGSLLLAWRLAQNSRLFGVHDSCDVLSANKRNLGFSTTSNAAFLVPVFQCALYQIRTPSALLVATTLLQLTVSSTAWNVHVLGGHTVFLMNDRAAMVTVSFSMVGLAIEYATAHTVWWATILATWTAFALNPLIIKPQDPQSTGGITRATLSSMSRYNARPRLASSDAQRQLDIPGPPDDLDAPAETSNNSGNYSSSERHSIVSPIAVQAYSCLRATHIMLFVAPVCAILIVSRRLFVAASSDISGEGLGVVGEAIASLPIALFGAILQLRRGLPALDALRKPQQNMSGVDASATFQFYDAVCGTFHVACAMVIAVVVEVCMRVDPLTDTEGLDCLVVGLTSGVLFLAPIAVLLGYDSSAWSRGDEVDAPRLLAGLYALWMMGTCLAWLIRLTARTSMSPPIAPPLTPPPPLPPSYPANHSTANTTDTADIQLW